jgi:hypothetical protein
MNDDFLHDEPSLYDPQYEEQLSLVLIEITKRKSNQEKIEDLLKRADVILNKIKDRRILSKVLS